jgi:hypothetical protein
MQPITLGDARILRTKRRTQLVLFPWQLQIDYFTPIFEALFSKILQNLENLLHNIQCHEHYHAITFYTYCIHGVLAALNAQPKYLKLDISQTFKNFIISIL